MNNNWSRNNAKIVEMQRTTRANGRGITPLERERDKDRICLAVMLRYFNLFLWIAVPDPASIKYYITYQSGRETGAKSWIMLLLVSS